jgi:hypothetical protein
MVQATNISTGNAAFADPNATGTIVNDDPTSVASNGRTVTFTDQDGDVVTLKTTKGSLTGKVTFVPTGVEGGLQIAAIDLTDPSFANANITVTAKATAAAGNGFVNVGYLNAGMNSLGIVSVNGDLGQIDAASVKGLTVQSIGKLGLSTQDNGSLESNLTGNLTRLTVKTDVVGATIRALNFGTVNIGGNVIGGDDDYTGSIEAVPSGNVGGRIGSLTIGGTLRAGDNPLSGTIIGATAGTVKIKEIDGGRIFLSGNTIVGGATPLNNRIALALGSLTVSGSVKNADILVGYDRTGAAVYADVKAGRITVNGDWEASDLAVGVQPGLDGDYGTDQNSVFAGGGAVVASIASITVKGQIIGTLDNGSDSFGFVAEQISAFTVGKTRLKLGNALAPADNRIVSAEGDVVVREYRVV